MSGGPSDAGLELAGALGVTGQPAVIALHVTPVLLGTALLAGGQAALRNQPRRLRAFALTALGMATGFAMSYCIDLFGVFAALFDTLIGPSQASNAHVIGWAVSGLCVFWAMLMGAIALFGAPAAQAIRDSATDPDEADVRPHERRTFGLGAVGLATNGISLGAVTLLDQTAARGETGLVLVATAAFFGLLSAAVSWRLWSSYDEFMRRQVINAFAASSVVLSSVAFMLVLVQGLGAAVTVTPYAIVLTVTLVQLGAAIFSAFSLGAEPRGARA